MLHPYEATAEQSAEQWVSAAEKWSGGFDALIHCAGVLHQTPLLFLDHQQEVGSGCVDQCHKPWRLTRAAWLHLVATGRGVSRCWCP